MDYRACTRQVPEDHFALEGDGGVEGGGGSLEILRWHDSDGSQGFSGMCCQMKNETEGARLSEGCADCTYMTRGFSGMCCQMKNETEGARC
jgi:hypothetical protein